MKMLTLWACIEPADRPAETAAPEQVLAWKQAWKSIDRAERPQGGTTPDQKCAARHPVT
jgi:hypothetical protein